MASELEHLYRLHTLYYPAEGRFNLLDFSVAACFSGLEEAKKKNKRPKTCAPFHSHFKAVHLPSVSSTNRIKVTNNSSESLSPRDAGRGGRRFSRLVRPARRPSSHAEPEATPLTFVSVSRSTASMFSCRDRTNVSSIIHPPFFPSLV